MVWNVALQREESDVWTYEYQEGRKKALAGKPLPIGVAYSYLYYAGHRDGTAERRRTETRPLVLEPVNLSEKRRRTE